MDGVSPEIVGRFDVKGTPGLVVQHEADQFVPNAGYPRTSAQLFSSYEGIDTDLPEGEYWVVRIK